MEEMQDQATAQAHHDAGARSGRRWLATGWLTTSEVHQRRTQVLALQAVYEGPIAVEDRGRVVVHLLAPTAGGGPCTA